MTSLHDIVALVGRRIGTTPRERQPFETPRIVDLISRIDEALSARASR